VGNKHERIEYRGGGRLICWKVYVVVRTRLNLQESYNGKPSTDLFRTSVLIVLGNVGWYPFGKRPTMFNTVANCWWGMKRASLIRQRATRRYTKRDSPLSDPFRKLSFENVRHSPPSSPQAPRFVCMNEVATGQVHHSSKWRAIHCAMTKTRISDIWFWDCKIVESYISRQSSKRPFI